MVIKSSYDTDYYAEIDDIDGNTVKLDTKLDEAYLKGFEAGKYLYSKGNCDVLAYHECLGSDIKNIISQEVMRYLYSSLDTSVIFDIRNDISYWMDVMTKSGSVESFEVNVYPSEDVNSLDVNVIYTDTCHKEHSITATVSTGAFC